MIKQTINKVANIIFYISCIVFIASLSAVYYFNHFGVMVKGHVIYWVYLAPVAMVLYTLIKNHLLREKKTPCGHNKTETKTENTLEDNIKNS